MTLEQLLEKCQHAKGLPEVPELAFRLAEELGSQEPNPLRVERLILSDPAMTAQVLRYACSAAFGMPSGSVKTVNDAIRVLGYQNLHGIAVASWLHSTFMAKQQNEGRFDGTRFAAHGAFTGFLARYLLSCALKKGFGPCRMNPDEIFASAVLCDLGDAVLAHVSPRDFSNCASVASRRGWTVDTVFQMEYGVSVSLLGYSAARTWQLPAHLLVPLAVSAGEAQGDELVTACLAVAKEAANAHGFGLYHWRVEAGDLEESLLRVGIEPGELESIVQLVTNYVSEYVDYAVAA